MPTPKEAQEAAVDEHIMDNANENKRVLYNGTNAPDSPIGGLLQAGRNDLQSTGFHQGHNILDRIMPGTMDCSQVTQLVATRR